MQTADVVIVGGGTSGSATALALIRVGLSVILLERTHYEKVGIGETVAPEIRTPLCELGLWDRFLKAEHNPSHANRAVWGSPEIQYQDFIFNPYGSGWHLDRRQFDRMLADAAGERGAGVFQGARVTSLRPTAKGWKVEGQTGAQTLSVQARYVIDATGRRSTVARRLGHRRVSHDRLIGLVGFLAPACNGARTDDTLLLEAVEDGWWYSVPLHDGRLVAVYMTDFDLFQGAINTGIAFWSEKLVGADYTGERIRGFRRPERLFVRPADTSITEEPCGPGFIAVGDAGAAFDPLSSQGICKALLSGIRAAEAISEDRAEDGGAVKNYGDQLRKEFTEYLELRTVYYRMESRWPESVFWRRRQQIDPQRVELPSSRDDDQLGR